MRSPTDKFRISSHDAQIFTNDRAKLPTALDHEISKQSADAQINTQRTTSLQQEISAGRDQEHSSCLGIGL